jgi:hypothetical protein
MPPILVGCSLSRPYYLLYDMTILCVTNQSVNTEMGTYVLGRRLGLLLYYVDADAMLATASRSTPNRSFSGFSMLDLEGHGERIIQ